MGLLFDVDEVLRPGGDEKGQEGRHAAKVVARKWYETSKHIFPANRWVMYDPRVHVKKL